MHELARANEDTLTCIHMHARVIPHKHRRKGKKRETIECFNLTLDLIKRQR